MFSAARSLRQVKHEVQDLPSGRLPALRRLIPPPLCSRRSVRRAGTSPRNARKTSLTERCAQGKQCFNAHLTPLFRSQSDSHVGTFCALTGREQRHLVNSAREGLQPPARRAIVEMFVGPH